MFQKKNTGLKSSIEIDFYSENGKINNKRFELKPSQSKIIDTRELIKGNGEIQYLWYVAKSDRDDLNSYSVHKNLISDNFSGEHNF